jgi:hypothetical protein
VNEPSLPEDFEMLRKCRFGYRLVTDLQKGGTILWTLLAHDIGEHSDTHWIRKRVQDRFNRDLVYIGMEQRTH